MRVSNFFARCIFFVYFLLMALLIVYSFLSPKMEHHLDVLTGFLICCPVGYIVLRKSGVLFERFGPKTCFIVLLGLCLAIKLGWVLVFRIIPDVDYETFFDTAAALSRSFEIHNRYVALFPHIMGYSLFLSVFFEFFGVHYFIPPLLNVLLSTVSLAALYHICLRLGGGKAAVIAAVLWIIFPSQIIYNMLALSEPLYCTILLLIWLVIVKTYDRFPELNVKIVILVSILLALLLVLFNMTRPIAVIMLTALIIYLVLIDRSPVRIGKSVLKKTAYILTTVLFFCAFSFLGSRYIGVRLGEQQANVPGYNIYVGFNAESEGAWNPGDSALLTYYNELDGWSADKTQKQMLHEAIFRIKNGNIDFPHLMYNKYLRFLGDDASAVYNARTSLVYTELLSTGSNIFYFSVIAFSLLGAAKAMYVKNKSPLIIICLYAIGLILAQMLVEVAPRYHYSVTLPMLILAAYGISKASESQH
jgi:4-amino-4-deoxy-L-arabinose transferase-like glycosyltransferase